MCLARVPFMQESFLRTNIGGRSSQTQLYQLRRLFAINGRLHVSALFGHRQVFSQMPVYLWIFFIFLDPGLI
jgi:hypothetical protein